MATAFHIDGPCEVLYDGVVLGITDNDDLPSFQFSQLQKEIRSVSGGDAPTAIFATSATANISVTLVKWDDAVLDSILSQIGAGGVSANTYSPIIGQRVVGQPFAIKSINNLQPTVYFPNTLLRPDAISQTRFGNVERRLTLHAIAYPDNANELFTLSDLP